MTSQRLLLTQTLVGYVKAESDRKLAFALMMNNLPLQQFNDILDVFNDQGSMSAALQQGF